MLSTSLYPKKRSEVFSGDTQVCCTDRIGIAIGKDSQHGTHSDAHDLWLIHLSLNHEK